MMAMYCFEISFRFKLIGFCICDLLVLYIRFGFVGIEFSFALICICYSAVCIVFDYQLFVGLL